MNSSAWKTALRILQRDKGYAAINVVGLALAIACCLVLGVYLRSELTYDRHHANHERIYRVVNEFEFNGKLDRFAVTSTMLGPMLADDNAGVEAYVRFFNQGGGERFLRAGSHGQYWTDVFVADPNVFEVFTHEVLYGDPKTALEDPTSAAVSRSFAERHFGKENPLGRTISIENDEERRITLVFEDLPENSHLRYDVLFSSNQAQFTTPEDVTQRRQRLFNVNVFTYLLMRPGFDPSRWDQVSKEFFDRHMAETAGRIDAKWRSWLQPLADIHLYSDVPYDRPTGNRYYLYGFIAVAVFTLLVACINYMNLATARAAKRAREVGMRKILGSNRRALVAQFLAEAVLLALVAMVAALVLVQVLAAFTPLGELLGKPMPTVVEAPELALWALALAALVGFGSGLYPAFYLSAIVPVSALVGGLKGSRRESRLRETLVFVQLVISTAVIGCTLLMAAQMRYIASMSLGFERENRLIVTLRGLDVVERREALKTELLRHPGVLGVSWSNAVMGGGFNINVIQLETNDGVLEETTVNHMGVGPDYLDVAGMQIVAGRDFSDDMGTDRISAILVNEALVRNLRWAEPVGKRFQLGQNQSGTVIGVVRDFNFRSVHSEVEPFALYRLNESYAQVPPQQRAFVTLRMLVNISGDNVPATIDHIRTTIRAFDDERPLEFEFLDDALNELYLSEQRLIRLIGIFAGLCISIACLGLFGLAAYTTSRRTREIGLRKVLGARSAQIVALFARRTLALAGVAAVVAGVGAWLVMRAWLENFAFRTALNPLWLVGAAAVGLGIAYGTVAMQALKAARSRPVNALRYE